LRPVTKLKQRRQAMGLKQREVAEQAPITTRSYQYYEAGKRVPNVVRAKLIAKLLNSTVEELF